MRHFPVSMMWRLSRWNTNECPSLELSASPKDVHSKRRSLSTEYVYLMWHLTEICEVRHLWWQTMLREEKPCSVHTSSRWQRSERVKRTLWKINKWQDWEEHWTSSNGFNSMPEDKRRRCSFDWNWVRCSDQPFDSQFHCVMIRFSHMVSSLFTPIRQRERREHQSYDSSFTSIDIHHHSFCQLHHSAFIRQQTESCRPQARRYSMLLFLISRTSTETLLQLLPPSRPLIASS